MKTKKLVTNALLIAMHVVLCYVSINFGNMVITMAGIPIIVGGLLYGPVAGLEIGLIGSFLNQLLKYGITATTVLWILPAGIRGLIIGLYAKHKKYRLSKTETLGILLLSGVVVTTLNTAVMYIDSKLYGYYSWQYVFGAIVFRYISAVVTNVIFAAILPTLMKYLNVFRIHDKEETKEKYHMGKVR